MKWQAIVDRIEGDIAILLVGDEEVKVDMPIMLLPKGVKEGDHLYASWQMDAASTEQAKQRVAELLEQLKDRNKRR